MNPSQGDILYIEALAETCQFQKLRRSPNCIFQLKFNERQTVSQRASEWPLSTSDRTSSVSSYRHRSHTLSHTHTHTTANRSAHTNKQTLTYVYARKQTRTLPQTPGHTSGRLHQTWCHTSPFTGKPHLAPRSYPWFTLWYISVYSSSTTFWGKNFQRTFFSPLASRAFSTLTLLSVALYLSLQDKLMSLMRIKTEGGEREKDRGGEEKRGEKQSDVALPSRWQWQSGAIMHEGCDIDCGVTSSADLLKSKHTL